MTTILKPFKNKFYLNFFILIIINSGLCDFNPIILIPGDGGSQVEARLNKTSVVHYICDRTSDYFNIWLNMELLVPLVIDCWIDNIKLIYNNNTRTTRDNDGVEIRIPGWGSTETVEWLDPSHATQGAYFNYIANSLVNLGHIRNRTIKGAPYDFRKAPNENKNFFLRLKDLIEETYLENQNQSVIILAHSMGGPMSVHFLNSQPQGWKDKYIRSLVTLSGVWGGSMKALKVYAIGDDLGTYVLREAVMREEQITSPSLAWLLPSKLYWDSNEVLIETDKKNFTVNDFEVFFRDINYMNGWEMRKDTEIYQTNLTAPGVEVHCLYGSSVPTVEKLKYKSGTWLDGYPELSYGDGDGTVNLRSLEGCKRWIQNKPIFLKNLPKVDHMSILSDKKVIEYISNLINSV